MKIGSVTTNSNSAHDAGASTSQRSTGGVAQDPVLNLDSGNSIRPAMGLELYESAFLFGNKVQLDNFDEVLKVLEMIEGSSGVKSRGEMSPGQVLKHCSDSIQMSMDGYPAMKSEVFRSTLGKVASWLFLNLGVMFHSLDDPIPGADEMGPVSLAEGVKALRGSVEAFRRFDKALKPHFAYGDLSKSNYEKVHAMHVANHLEGLVLNP